MAADEAPTPAQLIQQWRDEAKSIDADYVSDETYAKAEQLRVCADEMEAALRPRLLSEAEVARLTDGTDVEEWELQAGVDGY